MMTYAKAGGPPDNWFMVRVLDDNTGEEVLDVVEVNTEEGWMTRLKRENGNVVIVGDEIATERITGCFRIELKD